MGTFIDRRLGDRNKNRNNWNKFIRRIDEAYREGVRQLVNNADFDDLMSNKKKKISIPGKGLDEPSFVFKKNSGVQHINVTGNDRFKRGDTIDKPLNQQGKGKGGKSKDAEGESEDDDGSFSFLISKDEYLDVLFEELELPDMIKKHASNVESTILKRAGFSINGIPARLNILRSMKQAKGRNIAFTVTFQNEIIALQKKLNELLALDERTDDQNDEVETLKHEIDLLSKKIESIPFIQDTDLRYRRYELQKVPITRAVMFAIMDVSGSMADWDKEMAKRFFLLLALFIERQYEHMEIVWIIHTDKAWEVKSKEFFQASMSGGTHASAALTLAKQIIKERYDPNTWNIFMSQISDGDNSISDMTMVEQLMTEDILPIVQYYAYAETKNSEIYRGAIGALGGSVLYTYYKQLEGTFKNIKSSIITDVTTIYPIFRKLFEKKK